MPLPLLALLTWLKDNWYFVAAGLLAGAIYLYGHHEGAADVQGKWDADKLVRAGELLAAKDDAAAKAREASAAHQKDLAKMQATITQYERLVQYEIKRSYSGCVFTPELVSLWQKTFAPDVPAAGQP